METKKMLAKAKWQWHASRRVYYAQLYESCLDWKLKKKLRQKMNYHIRKLKDFA